MGRLTDSLRKAAEKLGDVESGIDQMASLGEKLAKNTANVADAALKLGYNYAKNEDSTPDPLVSEQTTEEITAEIDTLRQQLEKVQSSQNSLQTGNDLYRLQRAVVMQYLQEQDIEPAIMQQVEQIYKLRSIKKSPSLANKILKLAPAQVLRLLKNQLFYRKHLLRDET